MSMNVMRGDFVLDYVVAGPPRAVPGRTAMAAMVIVLLLALAATFLGWGGAGGAQGDAASDVLMQGP